MSINYILYILENISVDYIFRTIEIILQAIIIYISFSALNTWKKQLKGKDKYNKIKELINYIKQIRVGVHSKNSLKCVFFNDLNSNEDLNLGSFANKKVYFDENIIKLFKDIDVRGDMLLSYHFSKDIIELIKELKPGIKYFVDTKKEDYTYISLNNLNNKTQLSIADIKNGGTKDKLNPGIYTMSNCSSVSKADWTIQEYFDKWRKLVKLLLNEV